MDATENVRESVPMVLGLSVTMSVALVEFGLLRSRHLFFRSPVLFPRNRISLAWLFAGYLNLVMLFSLQETPILMMLHCRLVAETYVCRLLMLLFPRQEMPSPTGPSEMEMLGSVLASHLVGELVHVRELVTLILVPGSVDSTNKAPIKQMLEGATLVDSARAEAVEEEECESASTPRAWEIEKFVHQ